MVRKKILVVEDNEDNRHILVLRLRNLGEFDIREAATGQQALDCITQDAPDVVFLDLKMPVMDGWETARRIRALPTPLNQLPIIAITAYAMTRDKDKALAAGCDEYITKPIIDIEQIREKLEWLLTYSRPANSASATRQG